MVFQMESFMKAERVRTEGKEQSHGLWWGQLHKGSSAAPTPPGPGWRGTQTLRDLELLHPQGFPDLNFIFLRASLIHKNKLV